MRLCCTPGQICRRSAWQHETPRRDAEPQALTGDLDGRLDYAASHDELHERRAAIYAVAARITASSTQSSKYMANWRRRRMTPFSYNRPRDAGEALRLAGAPGALIPRRRHQTSST